MLNSGINNSIVSIVVYKPKEGKSEKLYDILKEHVTILRNEGLVTSRPSTLLKAKDGTYIEIFEWISGKAIDDAHNNIRVQEMWNIFHDACEYIPLSNLEESKMMFAGFEPVNF